MEPPRRGSHRAEPARQASWASTAPTNSPDEAKILSSTLAGCDRQGPRDGPRRVFHPPRLAPRQAAQARLGQSRASQLPEGLLALRLPRRLRPWRRATPPAHPIQPGRTPLPAHPLRQQARAVPPRSPGPAVLDRLQGPIPSGLEVSAGSRACAPVHITGMVSVTAACRQRAHHPGSCVSKRGLDRQAGGIRKPICRHQVGECPSRCARE